MVQRLFCLLGLVALALVGGLARAAPPATATVEYTITSPMAPAPGLTFDSLAPWLGWAGKNVEASWEPARAQITLYLPDPGGTSRCPPLVACVATPVTYRLVRGWQSITVLSWPPTVPWYLGYAGDAVPYTVAADRLIVQLGPQEGAGPEKEGR